MVIRNRISSVYRTDNQESVVFMVDASMFDCIQSSIAKVKMDPTISQHCRSTQEDTTSQEMIHSIVWGKAKDNELNRSWGFSQASSYQKIGDLLLAWKLAYQKHYSLRQKSTCFTDGLVTKSRIIYYDSSFIKSKRINHLYITVISSNKKLFNSQQSLKHSKVGNNWKVYFYLNTDSSVKSTKKQKSL